MGLYRVMSVLIEQPLLALLPALLLLAGAAATRSRGAAVCGLAWAVYTAYELAMRARILCSGECNIRIDLLAIYPALLVTAFLGLVLLVRSGVRRFNA